MCGACRANESGEAVAFVLARRAMHCKRKLRKADSEYVVKGAFFALEADEDDAVDSEKKAPFEQ